MDPVKVMIVGCTAAGLVDSLEETAVLLIQALSVVRKAQHEELYKLFTITQEDENERRNPSI
ncbi:MAG: hypothetical protein ACC608_09425 [Anaerofustis sp.]